MNSCETVASASAQRRREQNKLAQRKFRQKRLEAQRLKQRQHDAAAGSIPPSSSTSGVLLPPDSEHAGLGFLDPEFSLPPPPAAADMLYAGPEAGFTVRDLVGATSEVDLPVTIDLQQRSGWNALDPTLTTHIYAGADPSNGLSTVTDAQPRSDWNVPALQSLDDVHTALPASTLNQFPSHDANQQSSASAHGVRNQPSTAVTSGPADDLDWLSTMHIAAQSGRAHIVQRLLSSGVSCEERDNDGRTPLMLATIEGHVDVVRVLVEHGACLEQVDHAGRSVLHLAVWQFNDAIMKYLLTTAAGQPASRSYINAYDHHGWTALHLAIYEGYETGMSMLLQHGANPNLKAKRCPDTGSIVPCYFLQQDLFSGP